MPTVTFVLRALLLNPVILGAISAVVVPLVGWRAWRRLRGLATAERVAGVLVVVVFLAGTLSWLAARWGTPLGDIFRLRALQRDPLASQAPPGVRLLSEHAHASTYAGIPEYSADYRDPPDRTVHQRAYRAEGPVPEVFAGFERLAAEHGWKLVRASCDARTTGRLYEREVSGFRAVLGLSSTTTESTAFPGTAVTDVNVRLAAPSVLAGGALAAGTVDPACRRPPPDHPRPPAPPGACDAARRKLAVAVPGAAAPRAERPLRAPRYPSDLRWMQVRPADERIVHSDPPSEPRDLLERHGALDGRQDYDVTLPGRGRARVREATYAYQFPTPETARAFHADAVARACAQAFEAFDVPGAPDAVGLRLYVPATGPDCRERRSLQWAMDDSSYPGCGDVAVDYVAFARGQYHLSVVVGNADEDGVDLAAHRNAVLRRAAAAVERAREVATLRA